MIAALRFKVNDDYCAIIYPVGTYEKVDWDIVLSCALGEEFSAFKFKEENSHPYLMNIVTGLDGEAVLRLVETKRYYIRLKLNNDQHIDLPSLQNEDNKSLKIDKDENSVLFQFINYLGRSKIFFSDHGTRRALSFEVVPDKMNYEDDYIELTESLAERCSELLLDYSGSTSNVFSSADNNAQTLLEQFIFLRQFCFSENLHSLFGEIKRNPDRILVEEEEFHPLGCGMPSKKIYSHPFKYARNWNGYTTRDGARLYFPSETVVSHKRENLDTPANRFLKYALEQFDAICLSLIESLNQNSAQKQTECRKEAKVIHGMINDILQDRFFEEVGILDVMPQNNQVLQKREGYLQVFAAYSMIDLALQLDWKGKNNVYEGESKNVALLYEYWLFFELVEIIKSIDGCIVQESDEDPFVSADRGNLTISLKEGERSCQSFHIPKLETKINLYYNRSFMPTEFKSTQYEGSYSRPFRPDYSIAVFPDRYDKGKLNGEVAAKRDGAVSFVHFDAKYRITDLTSLLGKCGENADEEKLEIEDEKAEAVINTYKRGDLLKMHTYNDAIRRTVGSYVLYPGKGTSSDYKRHIFSLYDEILPGVGAFAIKPSISNIGEAELKRFITNLITEKSQISSRLNRLHYYSEMVLRDPASSETVKSNSPGSRRADALISDKLCVIGYMRADSPDDYFNYLKDSGYLKNGAEFYFYYYAIKDGVVYSHHRDITRAGTLRIFTNDISNTSEYHLEPVLLKVEDNELISKADLVQRLISLGYMTNIERHHADYYYAFKVRVVNDLTHRVNLKIADVNAIYGNDSYSPHSPKVVPIEIIE